MINLTSVAARTVLAALLAISPLALAAQTATGSPAQSVDADRHEEVAGTSDVDCSLVADDAKSDGEPTDCDDADVVNDTDGSLVEEGAKSDG